MSIDDFVVLIDCVCCCCSSSDADPDVLAKYVIALLHKDKPEKYLRQNCLKQLEIFLCNETSSFVDRLFDAIKNKSYLDAGTADHASKPEAPAKGNEVSVVVGPSNTNATSVSGPTSSTSKSGPSELKPSTIEPKKDQTETEGADFGLKPKRPPISVIIKTGKFVNNITVGSTATSSSSNSG